MSSSNHRVRRATLDDRSALKALWESMRFTEPDLDKRLTEFQVVEDPDGKLVGALALQLSAKHGRIYGEGFTDFALADQLRPLFWERLQSLALNHGLVRLWTQEHAPFWKQCGLLPADAKSLEKLPPAWGGASASWFTIQLRDETAVLSVDKEFELFREAEKRRIQNALRYAKTIKIAATVIAIILALFVVVAAIRLFQQNPQMLGR